MTTWRNLEGIMLSEITQRQIPYDFTYVWNPKNRINTHNRNSLIDTENGLTIITGEGAGGVR